MMFKNAVWQAAGESHLGLARRKNEDSFCFAFSPDGKILLAVVADGIGGHSRGEKASYICCRELVSAFLKEASRREGTADRWRTFLSRELERINGEIYIRNRANRALRPMGTTVNSCLFLENEIIMANAGDSRLYEVNGAEEAVQLSTDHSFKAVSAEHAAHGMENVIYRALGLYRNFEYDLESFSPRAGARYLLCTDGMYRCMDAGRVGTVLRETSSPQTALNVFMRSALVAGGRDNITGIAVFPKDGR